MVRYQEYVADSTKGAFEQFFSYAKNVPEDKVEWAPAEGGRSVLSLAREIAMTPIWAVDTIEGRDNHEDQDAYIKQMEQMQAEMKTVADCEAFCYKHLDSLLKMMREMPDDRLSDTRWLPYEGGRDFTMVEMFDYARWNANYHLGQVAYIQLCYGDKEMY